MVTVRPAVFLDRDGVLCRPLMRAGRAYAPRRFDDFRLVPNASRSVQSLKEHGYVVVVVTNQPDIGNGLVGADIVEQMHQRLRARVSVDAVLTCPHRPSDDCDCRKPRPGMLLSAARSHEIDLSRSFMVGDRASDVEAGRRAGCRTVFIDRRYAEAGLDRADVTVRSLQGAAAYILLRSLSPGFGAKA